MLGFKVLVAWRGSDTDGTPAFGVIFPSLVTFLLLLPLPLRAFGPNKVSWSGNALATGHCFRLTQATSDIFSTPMSYQSMGRYLYLFFS
jgi:hypothetical protein